MFDRLYFYATRLRKHRVDTTFKPEEAIKGRQLVNPNRDKLAVIFPNWHGGGVLYSILVKRLTKRGWAVLYYQFNPQILAANEEQVINSFKFIQQKVSEDLKDLLGKHAYQKTHLIGVSLGNVALTMVANDFSKFDSATLVVAGDDLAADMWHGFMTQDLRRAFQKSHIGIRRLDDDWRAEAPINYAKHFSGKQIIQLVSVSDKVIRTDYQRKMANALTEAGADVMVKTTRLGHVLSIVKYCFFGPLP